MNHAREVTCNDRARILECLGIMSSITMLPMLKEVRSDGHPFRSMLHYMVSVIAQYHRHSIHFSFVVERSKERQGRLKDVKCSRNEIGIGFRP